MPYVVQGERKLIDPIVKKLIKVGLSDGDINYAIATLLKGTVLTEVNYSNIQRAIGVLECAKLEIYRRVAAPYENKKAKQNGDVFDWQPDGQLHTEIVADPRLEHKVELP